MITVTHSAGLAAKAKVHYRLENGMLVL